LLSELDVHIKFQRLFEVPNDDEERSEEEKKQSNHKKIKAKYWNGCGEDDIKHWEQQIT